MSWHNGDPGTTPEQEKALEKVYKSASRLINGVCLYTIAATTCLE